jgi:hypothetical protein
MAIQSVDRLEFTLGSISLCQIFEEERELTVMLLVDVSGSNEICTRSRFKREFMTEFAAVLAFSAIQNNDKIGVILFSDRIERFIPPKKGKITYSADNSERWSLRPSSKGLICRKLSGT